MTSVAKITKTVRSIPASEQEWLEFRAWCLERGWTLGKALGWFIELTKDNKRRLAHGNGQKFNG